MNQVELSSILFCQYPLYAFIFYYTVRNLCLVTLGQTTVELTKPTLTTLTAEWMPAGGDGLTGYEVIYREVVDTNGVGVEPAIGVCLSRSTKRFSQSPSCICFKCIIVCGFIFELNSGKSRLLILFIQDYLNNSFNFVTKPLFLITGHCRTCGA